MTQQWAEVDEYLEDRLLGPDEGLDAVIAASTTGGLPAIAVSPTQAKFLELLTRISGAKRVLEVGTLGGYSAIHFARGVGDGGTVITLELDQHHADVAAANLVNENVDDRVEIIVGRAVDSMDAMIEAGAAPFDLIFIDADKESNPAYVERAIALSHPGTVLVVDNVIRSGEVANSSTANTGAIGTRTMFDLINGLDSVDATAIQTVGSKGYDGLLIGIVTP